MDGEPPPIPSPDGPPPAGPPRIGPLPGQPTTVTVRAAANAWPAQRVIAVVGAGVLLLGSVLPWATVSFFLGSISVNGTEGDGKVTLFCALIAGLFLAISDDPTPRVIAAIAFAIAGAVCIYDVTNISGAIDEARAAGVNASVGYGLWLATVASIGGFLGAVVKR